MRTYGWLEEGAGVLDGVCGGPNRDASADLIGGVTSLPERTNNLWATPAIFKDQGASNSCVAHGLSNGAETRLTLLGIPVKPSSRRQLYTLSNMLLKRSKAERLRDEGTYPRTALRAAEVWGVASEEDWPLYDPRTGVLNDVTKEVPIDVLQRASAWKLVEQATIYAAGDARIAAVRAGLANREPIPVAGDWDRAAENYKGGVLGPPNLAERIGGHMVCLIDYRPSLTEPGHYEFLLLNSWGGWGLTIDGRQSLAWVSEAWVKAQRELFRMTVTKGRRIA